MLRRVELPPDDAPVLKTRAERMALTVRLGMAAWAFSRTGDAAPGLPRHTIRVLRIDILTEIDTVTFDAAWQTRVPVVIDALVVPVLGRAELIANMEATGRPQDLADVARLRAADAG